MHEQACISVCNPKKICLCIYEIRALRFLNSDLKKSFVISGFAYAALTILLFPYLRYYADNPDSFEYITIAQKYSSFNLHDAVNGYWSPLISWLLMIPMQFADPVTAFKFLQVATGLFTLYQWCRLLDYST